MIRAQALVKRFGDSAAVNGFSFEVGPGEIYGLLGPNGAGKTTTVRMLSCLLRPTSGTAQVAGYSIDEHPTAIRQRIGILTEVPGLYGRLTPLEYLDFFAQVHNLRGATARARIEAGLRLVGMWDRRSVVMRGFSKGMQQRIAIARTLLHEAPVLFFDEPTAALDPEAARNVRDHLQELAIDGRRTVLLCTHNLNEAERVCNRLSVVQSGAQVVEGTPAELKRQAERTVVLQVRHAPAEVVEAVRRVVGAVDVVESGVAYRTTKPDRTNPDVVRAAVAAGADVVGLTEEAVSLEDVYLALVRGPGIAAPPTAEARIA